MRGSGRLNDEVRKKKYLLYVRTPVSYQSGKSVKIREKSVNLISIGEIREKSGKTAVFCKNQGKMIFDINATKNFWTIL